MRRAGGSGTDAQEGLIVAASRGYEGVDEGGRRHEGAGEASLWPPPPPQGVVDDVLDKTKQLFAKIFGQLCLDSVCHTVAHVGTTTAAFGGCALTTVVCTTICVLGALRLLRIIRTKFVLFVRCPVGLDLDVSFATERVGLAVAIFECLLFTSDVSVAVELCRFV